MTFKHRAAAVGMLIAAGLSGCGGDVTGPTALPSTVAEVVPPPLPRNSFPAFRVADVVLSGLVFETTSQGRMPIAGVIVANGEGNHATTDANGIYSVGPVWVCPCARQPWVEAGITFLWVAKDGYGDPPDTPGSVFERGAPSPGTRDVKIDGDTRFDIELVRR
jgi:hypothetical protein